MNTRNMRSAFRSLPALFLTFMAFASLILCLSVMHSAPAAANVSVAPGDAAAVTLHHDLSVQQSSGTEGTVATCQGPCGQEHSMTAALCAVALLVPMFFIGAARTTPRWRLVSQRMQDASLRVGPVAPLMPPSLFALSISRT